MVASLNEIAQSSSDAPLVPPEELSQLTLHIDRSFTSLAQDAQVAQNLMSSPELGQRVKIGVQKLGTICIELVKSSGQRRMFANDHVLSLLILIL